MVRKVFSDVLVFLVSVRCVALNNIEVRSESSVYDSCDCYGYYGEPPGEGKEQSGF